MGESLKSKVVKGTLWVMLTKISMKVLSFGVTLVLARLLTPSDYGTISLLTIFIAIASTLAESGFGNALVQKKDATQTDFNTIFYTSLVVSSGVYMVLFFCAPAIARFYNTPSLVSIMRVLALNLIFSAVNGVQNAELSRNMRFDVGFWVSLISHLASAVFGISLAFFGFGAWALVAHTLAANVGSTFALWLLIAWRPRLDFSWTSLRQLWGFGWKLTASHLVDTAYRNIYGLIVGKLYTKEDLAYVEKGNSVPFLAMSIVSSTLGSVMYPVLTKLQDDKVRFRAGMRRMIQFSTFIILPMMAGVAVCAPYLVKMMFGDQWAGCVVYVQLACFSFALWPMHVINLNAISAQGRSDIYLKLEIIKKLVGLPLIFASYRYGVICMMAVSAFVSSPIGLMINLWPNQRLLGYTIAMQLRDIMPAAILSSVMAAIILALNRVVGVDSPWMLALDVPVGVLCYFALSWVFRLRPMADALVLMMPFFNRVLPDRVAAKVTSVAVGFEKGM